MPLVVLAAPIDASKSKLEATFTQFNVPVTGEFRKFSGDVSFDPAKPEATTAKLTVDTSSYDLGDPMYNDEVAGKDWFDHKNHPEAVFELQSVTPEGNKYQAKGQLTLRGVTKPVQFPAELVKSDKAFSFKGTAEIKRLDYGIGQGDWSDTALVEDPVQIKFNLVLPR